MTIKHYQVFDQIVVPYFVDGYRNEEVVGLKPVGLVKATSEKDAIGVAKARGFKTPIVQEHRKERYVASLENAEFANDREPAVGRGLKAPAHRDGYTRKS